VGEIFNIGNNEEVSIEELASRVRRIAKSQSEITYTPYDQAYEEGFEDMPRRVPSLEKIGRFIGYRPKTSLDEIITKVVEFERNRRARAVPQAALASPVVIASPAVQQPALPTS
jgi:UDP-glucose 4-epimerase